jgi:hypothetical protein
MSSIFFHSPYSKGVRLSGSERAYMEILVSSVSMGSIYYNESFFDHWILKVYPPERGKRYEDVRIWLTGPLGLNINIDGELYDKWHLSLNTAIAIGSDVIVLMARLHGQCEVHCYVEGHNRKWLAKIIRDGLEQNLLREGRCWESVIEFLERSNKHPVVCSYSVCDSFPGNRTWKEGLEDIRSPSCGLELCPESFRDIRYGHGLTYFDLKKIVLEKNNMKMVDSNGFGIDTR